MEEFDHIANTLKGKFRNVPLSSALLDYMVEKITVYEDRHVEIQFKFDDVFRKITEILKGGGK